MGANMYTEDERTALLEAVSNVAYLIEETAEPAKIAEYIDQLSKLKLRLVALGSPKRKAATVES